MDARGLEPRSSEAKSQAVASALFSSQHQVGFLGRAQKAT